MDKNKNTNMTKTDKMIAVVKQRGQADYKLIAEETGYSYGCVSGCMNSAAKSIKYSGVLEKLNSNIIRLCAPGTPKLARAKRRTQTQIAQDKVKLNPTKVKRTSPAEMTEELLIEGLRPMTEKSIKKSIKMYEKVLKHEEKYKKLTECGALLGELAELKVAQATQGALTVKTNSPGFDVVSKRGLRVSVKASAAGKFTFNRNTYFDCDVQICLKYSDKKWEIIYNGCPKVLRKDLTVDISNNTYELTINKMQNKNVMPSYLI